MIATEGRSASIYDNADIGPAAGVALTAHPLQAQHEVVVFVCTTIGC
jgi:hypothetical protein